MSETINIGVIARQNNNKMSAAYGKYYYQVNKDNTLTTRGFLQHIQDHGLAIPRAVAQACLSQITSCLKELLLRGIPVKLDGLGTFTPTVSSSGVLDSAELGKNMRGQLKGVHFRLIPDGTELDNTTSTENALAASYHFDGVMVGDMQGNAPTNKQQAAIVSLKQFIEMQTAPVAPDVPTP